MLIDEWHVVTCAHVVSQQFGQPRDMAGTTVNAPAGEVVVEFPFADGVVARRARVVGWRPIGRDLSGDAAVLRLAEPIVLTPAPLVSPPSLHGHRFWVHGFPGGAAAARQAQGRLVGASGPTGEWVQIESDSSTGWPIEHGFSGAPVFDEDAGGVVGIVGLRDQHRSGHLLPVSYLRALLPRLDWRVGWRLDLDASLKTHWLPRARGSEIESDTGGWYFTGRHAARQAICDWLTVSGQQLALVVTGGPGAGKSALLAHLLVSADPVLRGTVPTSGPRPPAGAFDIAVHVAGLTCDDVVQRLATAAGVEATTPQELLVAVRERHQAGYALFTVLADAVEEAASVEEARQIATLLRNLAATGTARVLAGIRTAPTGSDRARIRGAFGSATSRIINLESRDFLRNYDIADYVERRLTDEETGSVRYRNRSAVELRAIGRAVARKARYNFLIAQLATRWLTHPTTAPLNLNDPAWEHGLPETIGHAMDTYLDTCGPDTALVRRLLTALAFARGNGLPRDQTWCSIADALHPGHTHSLAALEAVFHSAANYLIERTNSSQDHRSYRLYHDALDEHLREHCPTVNPQQAIVTALTNATPRRDQQRNWATAAPYIRTHLAGHAAQANRLDDLLTDTGFLLHAEPGTLLAALPHTTTEHGRITAAAYRMSNDQHRHAHPAARCRILARDAARLGARDLQRQLNTAQDHLDTPTTQAGWRVRFATGSTLPTSTIATFAGHYGGVEAVAVGELDGRPIAVTASNDRTVRIWDLAEHRQIGAPLAGHTGSVNAIALGEVDGHPVAVTAGWDDTVRVWDLAEHRQIMGIYTGQVGGVTAVAVCELDGRPVAVTASWDKRVRVWDLADQHRVGAPLAGHSGGVTAVAVCELDGRPVAVTASWDKTVRVWDLADQRQVGAPLTGHTANVNAVAVGELDARPVAVTGGGGEDMTVRVWDLAEHRQIGAPLTGHTGSVTAVAVGELDGRPVAVTGSDDRTVRVWDLAEHRQIGAPLTGHTANITAVAVSELDARPIAVTGGGEDMTARVWDLADQRQVGAPLTGHTANITAIAVGELDARPIAVTASRDDTVRVWDLAEHCQIKGIYTGDTGGVTAVAVSEVDGRPVAVTGGGSEDMARLWDLAQQRRMSQIQVLTGRTGGVDTGSVNAAAVGELDGRPIVIAVTGFKDIAVWDRAKNRLVGVPLTGHTDSINAVAVGELDGRPIAVTGSDDKTIRVWDLTEHRQVGAPLTGHSGSITAVTVGELDGCPVAITGGGLNDMTVRVWDLKRECCLDELTMPGAVTCMALGRHGTLAVGFGCDIIVFDAKARLVPHALSPFPRRQSRWWKRFVNR